MTTYQGWTDAGRVAMGSTPSALRAGDVYDSGYVVQVFAANGYWTAPVGMRETHYATLDEAREATQAHDQDVLAGRVKRFESNRGRITSEKYRISRRIATYTDSNTCGVERQAWGWVDLNHPASNAATHAISGTHGDFVSLPAESDI